MHFSVIYVSMSELATAEEVSRHLHLCISHTLLHMNLMKCGGMHNLFLLNSTKIIR